MFLGLLALLLAFMAVLNLVGQRVDSTLNALLHAVVLGSSAIICFMFGLPAVRRRRMSEGDAVEEEGTRDGDQGTDEGTDEETE
jgi:hypothetical protein